MSYIEFASLFFAGIAAGYINVIGRWRLIANVTGDGVNGHASTSGQWH